MILISNDFWHKRKMIILTHTMYCWLLLLFCAAGSHMQKSVLFGHDEYHCVMTICRKQAVNEIVLRTAAVIYQMMEKHAQHPDTQ